MKEKIHGIVLGTVRHNDRHNVTTVFTRERGKMAFLTPTGSGARSRASAARVQLMSVFEAEINVSTQRELQFPSSYSLLKVWRTLWFEPVKMTLVMFVSEFLSRLPREAPPDAVVWDYILESMETLDNTTDMRTIANFHIAFLIGLLPLMGIQPDLTDYADGMEFDMKAGSMVVPWSASGGRSRRIVGEDAARLTIIERMNFRNARYFRMSSAERSRLLNGILSYYGVHFPGADSLRSLDVLSEIFA